MDITTATSPYHDVTMESAVRLYNKGFANDNTCADRHTHISNTQR